MPHEQWLQSHWFFLSIILALFCLFFIIIKFRKQISKQCKTTKDKWSVKFEGRENAVSKPPSQSASIDEDTELEKGGGVKKVKIKINDKFLELSNGKC